MGIDSLGLSSGALSSLRHCHRHVLCVSSRDWGKAVAIHELAPNLGFVAAPLVAEGLMLWFPWRGVIALIGAAAMVAGMAFIRLGKGGQFRGETPSPQALRSFLPSPHSGS